MIPAADLEKAYSEGLLDKVHHLPLLKDSKDICVRAGVPERALLESLSVSCSDTEVELVKGIRHHINKGVSGICYEGDFSPAIEDKFIGITASLLRNYMDARFCTVHQVLDRLKAGDMPNPTVLLIPNFYRTKENGGSVPTWQVGYLHDYLLARMASGKFTFICTDSLSQMSIEWGQSLLNHLKRQYIHFSGGN